MPVQPVSNTLQPALGIGSRCRRHVSRRTSSVCCGVVAVLTCGRRAAVLLHPWADAQLAGEEEAQHLLRRIGTLGVGVRATCATARPRVTCAVHGPVLGRHPGAGIAMDTPRVGSAVVRASALDLRGAAGRARRHHLLAIDGVDDHILIAVEDDGGRHLGCLRRLRRLRIRRARGRAVLHGGEGRWDIGGAAGGQARMHAHRGVQVGIRLAQDRGHRATSDSPAT